MQRNIKTGQWFSILGVIAGFVLIALGAFGRRIGLESQPSTVVLQMTFGLVLQLYGWTIFFLLRMYTPIPPGRALVRDGRGGRRSTWQGGIIVVPGLHALRWVSLEVSSMKISVDDMLSSDGFRMAFNTECQVRIPKLEDMVSVAADALGDGCMDPKILQPLIENSLRNAIRVVVGNCSFAELQHRRSKFAQALHAEISPVLHGYGLELCNVNLLDPVKGKESATSHPFTSPSTGIRLASS